MDDFNKQVPVETVPVEIYIEKHKEKYIETKQTTKMKWVIPALILTILFISWFVRWDYTASKTSGANVLKWKTDRWTGQQWIEKYNTSSIEEKPIEPVKSKYPNKTREYATKIWMLSVSITISWLLYVACIGTRKRTKAILICTITTCLIIWLVMQSNRYITVGSTTNEVKSILGEPTEISSLDNYVGGRFPYKVKYCDVYYYGKSEIMLKSDKVIGWIINDDPLKVRLGEKNNNAPPFYLHSSIKEITSAMGTPSGIFADKIYYGRSIIYLDDSSEVMGWLTVDKPLKVYLVDQNPNANPIHVGSNIQEVMSAMGTPTGLTQQKWYYGSSCIYFDELGSVIGWTTADKPLKVKD